MRIGLLIVGALAALTGLWWALQGTLGLFPGGQMAHKLEWAYAGGGMLLLGAALITASRMKKRN